MNQIVSNLLVYGKLPEDSILWQLADICEKLKDGTETKAALRGRVFHQVKNLLTVATDYAFDKNLWHNYLTFLLITNENPFSLVCEKMGAQEGTVNNFVTHDFDMFKELFDYDFSWLEKELSIDCFTQLTHYQAIRKKELMYNKNVSEKVRTLSEKLETAESGADFFQYVTEFYKDYGVGMFGLNKAFRVTGEEGDVTIEPITSVEHVYLRDLVGYERQKKKLVENTEAFIEGREANNVLLFGDSGTGKSSSIKAILNEYYDRGLRMIEVYKHQFQCLSDILEQIKDRNYKFIVYMDDLSFEEYEIEYKYLKAMIEGGLGRKPDNVLIYATSNRRHLIREKFSDKRELDDDLHKNDTVQEKLSLVARFGVTIYYGAPDKKEFQNIVSVLAEKYHVEIPREELLLLANQWELSHGGLSGRTAAQFITHLLGTGMSNKEGSYGN
mgnify:CR=1 FL=1